MTRIGGIIGYVIFFCKLLLKVEGAPENRFLSGVRTVGLLMFSVELQKSTLQVSRGGGEVQRFNFFFIAFCSPLFSYPP